MDRSYHSIQSSRSVESQPQSIVHQIIRLEKRVGKKVKKMFASKKHGDSKKSIGTEATQDSATASVDLTQSFHLESEDEYSVSSSSSSDSSCGCSSFQGSLDASIDVGSSFSFGGVSDCFSSRETVESDVSHCFIRCSGSFSMSASKSAVINA